MRKMLIPDDWDEEADGYCILFACIPNSFKWRAVYEAQFYDPTWYSFWDKDSGLIQPAKAIANEIYEGLCMANCEDIVNNLDRIATAMESIDSKTSLLYTWDELIEDVEQAFGTTSLIWSVIDGIVSKMPNLKAKVDMTWLAKAIWEYFTWKAPIQALITSIAAAQGVQAAAAATGRVLSILDTAMAALAIVQTTALGWKDIIFGDASIWDDLIRPLWALFISDDEGGEGGDDPDIDPTIRVFTRLTLGEEIMAVNITNNVNCGCGGSGCGNCQPTGEDSGAGSTIDQPERTIYTPSQTNPPPPGWSSWDGANGYLAYKCRAANALLLGFAESLGVLGDMQNNDFSMVKTLSSVVGWAIEILRPINIRSTDYWFSIGQPESAIAQNAQRWTAEQLAIYLKPFEPQEFNIFYDLRIDILNNRTDRVCELYNANSTGDARTALLEAVDDFLDGSSYDTEVIDWARLIIEGNLSNTWLNQLFQKVSNIDGYTDSTAVDCLTCSPTLQLTWGTVVSGSLNSSGTPFTVETEIAPGAGVPHGAIEIYSSVPIDVQISGAGGMTPHPDTTRYPYFHQGWYQGEDVDNLANPAPSNPPDTWSVDGIDHLFTGVTDPEGEDQELVITITEAS